MNRTLSASDLETIRHHLDKGVPRSTVAGWFGVRVLAMMAALDAAPSGEKESPPADPPPAELEPTSAKPDLPRGVELPPPKVTMKRPRIAPPAPAPGEAKRADLPPPGWSYQRSAAPRPAQKPCLRCRKPIPYDPHQRLCVGCRGTVTNMVGID